MAEDVYPKEVWDEKFRIASYHTDPFGNLKLTSLFELFQDAAGQDAARKGFGYNELIENNRYWVLLRVKLKIYSIPHWDEGARILTWPKDSNGITAFREFKIKNADDEDIILGTSTWTQLDTQSRRPVRIELSDNYHPVENMNVGLDKASKIKIPQDLNWAEHLVVKYSQIDVNHHVNNTRYLEWVLNELPFDLFKTHQFSDMEVNFLSEGKLGDVVRVGSAKVSENEWFACVQRVGDERVLYSAKFSFDKRKD